MRIRVIEFSWFARMLVGKNITLYPFIFLIESREIATERCELQHEYIHVLQIRRVGALKFYASYLWRFLAEYVRCWHREQAYQLIPWEVEAYQKQSVQYLPPDWENK